MHFVSKIVILFGCLILSTAKADIADLLHRKKLRVCIHKNDLPPFFYLNKKTKELEGYDIEISRDIAIKLKVQLEFERSSMTFDDVATGPSKGICDVAISNLARTLKRARFVSFTPGYYDFIHTLIINRSFRDMHKDEIVKKLNNPKYKIGIVKGTSFDEVIDHRLNKAKRVEYDDLSDLMNAIRDKKIDFTVREDIAIHNFLSL